LKERAFSKVLKATVTWEQIKSTHQARRLLVAFTASHPQVSVIHQEILIALAWYTSLWDVQAQDMPPRLLGFFLWVPVGRTINMSELDKELQTPNAPFEVTLKVTKKYNIWMKGKDKKSKLTLTWLPKDATSTAWSSQQNFSSSDEA
jgi:hypothetical protein